MDCSGEIVAAPHVAQLVREDGLQLARRQMVRDVERLFGRPLRAGGARLADQRVAEEILADKPIANVIAPANAAGATASETADAASAAPPRIFFVFIGATPFHEGLSALRSELVSWLPGPPAAPSRRLHDASGLLPPASPVTVAGPRRNHTGFPSLSTLDGFDPTGYCAGPGWTITPSSSDVLRINHMPLSG